MIQKLFTIAITGLGFVSITSAHAVWSEIDRVPLKRTPHYFFRVFPDGNSVVMNSHYHNYLLQFKRGPNGKIIDYNEVPLPGILDPVSSPDGIFVTIPTAGGHFIPFFGGMRFYLTQDLVNGKKHKVMRDSTLTGAYQTIGILKDDPVTGTRRYRAVSESVFNKKTGFFIQEYESKTQKDGKVKLTRSWNQEKRVCPDIPFTLPMLSKTGRFMGGRDPDTADTKIMSLDAQGNCAVYRNLERPTGKLSFSPDDRFATFHAESEFDLLGLRDERLIDTRPDVVRITRIRRLPSTDLNLNVFTYNLETREFDKVTHCRNSNCYYPDVTQNGDLVYLEQKKDSDQYFLVFLRNTGKPESSISITHP